MPELPEVETVSRDLRRLLQGAEVAAVSVLWTRSVALPSVEEFIRTLPGRRILDVGRRGKFVVLCLSGEMTLLIHLRMSGQLRIESAEETAERYARVIFSMADGRRLVFSDPRKFGRVYLTEDSETVIGSLGPEPLSSTFTLGDFAGRLSSRRGALKPLLLQQGFLAGLGNIYVDEALFVARLHPLRRANTLTGPEVQQLYVAIRRVLQEAVDNRGTTLSDARYRDAEGRPGHNRENLRVYRRGGEPCVQCGAPIERVVVSGRGTHLCPKCQPSAPCLDSGDGMLA